MGGTSNCISSLCLWDLICTFSLGLLYDLGPNSLTQLDMSHMSLAFIGYLFSHVALTRHEPNEFGCSGNSFSHIAVC